MAMFFCSLVFEWECEALDERGVEAFVRTEVRRNFGSGDVREDGVQLADAFGERGRAGLKDVSGFDLVDVAVADGRDGVPAWPGADEILVDLHAAPGADDDFGIARDNRRWIDDAGLRGLLSTEFGEDWISSGDFDEFFDPANAADQGIFPFLEKDARPEAEAGGGGGDGVEAGTQAGGKGLALFRDTDDAGEHENHVQDFFDAALIKSEYGDAARDELAHDIGLKVRKSEDQIGLDRHDFFEFRGDEGGDFRFPARLGWTRGVTGDADDAVLLAQQVEGLSGFLGETGDAARIAGHGRLLVMRFCFAAARKGVQSVAI